MLLEAGMKCFSEKGYASTTLGDIVARTGQTHGAFYGHFASKEELFQHILDYQFQLTQGWTDIPESFHPNEYTLEEVMTFILTRLSGMLQGVDNWVLALVDFYHHAKVDPAILEMFKEKYRQWVEGIERLVVELQERGWISRDKDPYRIAKQVIAFHEGFAIFAVFSDDRDAQTHLEGLVKLMT